LKYFDFQGADMSDMSGQPHKRNINYAHMRTSCPPGVCAQGGPIGRQP